MIKNTRIRTKLLYVGRFLLTLILLEIIFTRLELNNFLRILTRTNQVFIVPVCILIFFYFSLKSYKWYLLAKALDNKTTFGEAARLYLRGIGKSERLSGIKKYKFHLGSLLFVDKISDIWMISFFFLLGWQKILIDYKSTIIIIALAVIIILLYQFRNFNNQLTRYFPYKFLRATLRGFTLISWPLSNIILIISFLTMLVYLIQAYFLLATFYPVSSLTILKVFPLILLINLVPITIGSLGIRELAAIYLLGQFGVPAEFAVSSTLLLFVFNSLLPRIFGLILWRE